LIGGCPPGEPSFSAGRFDILRKVSAQPSWKNKWSIVETSTPNDMIHLLI